MCTDILFGFVRVDTARAQLSSIERGDMSQDEAQAIVYNEKLKEYNNEKQRLKVPVLLVIIYLF